MAAKKKKAVSRAVSIADLEEMGAFPRMTKGERLIRRFCASVTQGNAPKSDDMEKVAHALAALLDVADGQNARRDALEEVATRLELTKKQGRQPDTWGSIQPAVLSVVHYLRKADQFRAEGRANPDTLAAQATANLERITARAFRDRITKHRALAESIRPLADLLEAWRLEAKNREVGSGE